MYNPFVEIIGEFIDRFVKWLDSYEGKYWMYLLFSIAIGGVVYYFTRKYIFGLLIYCIMITPVAIISEIRQHKNRRKHTLPKR